jgi:hypothetical protein
VFTIKQRFTSILIIFLLVVFSQPGEALGFYTNMPASLVLGQVDFASNASNGGASSGTSATALFDVSGSFVSDGKLVVSDRSSHRVLIFNSFPTSNGAAADVVVGQASFTTNTANQGITRAANTMNTANQVLVAEGKLIVTEQTNQRVIIFNQIPTYNNASADVVIGQTDFSTATTNQGGRNANTINTPIGVSYYNGKLLIADAANSRILIFNSIPTTNKASADVVVGQSSFTVGSINGGGSTAANVLAVPYAVIVADGKLLISDHNNNRVLIFNQIPTTNGASADLVIGQQNLTSGTANQGGTAAANTLNNPRGLFYDGKKLYITDSQNNRVLIFNKIPTTNNASADVVLGQQNFTSTTCNQGSGAFTTTTANKLCTPGYGVYKWNNKLLVPDGGNRRLLVFEDYSSTPQLGFGGIETLSEGSLRLKGSAIQGERGKFAIQYIYASLNGQGEKLATNIGAGTEEGSDKTKYEFYHDYSPWEGSGIEKNKWSEELVGYTLKIRAVNFNADENNMFLFKPFTLDSFNTNGGMSKVSFHVGDKYIDRIKDNIEKFEVWAREVKVPANKTAPAIYTDWKKYIENIPSSSIDTKGVITYQTPNTLTSKEWEIRVKAISKGSGYAYESNTVSASGSGVVLKNSPETGTLTKGWFPLQIDNISGIKDSFISSTNTSTIKAKYKSTTKMPTLVGTAFSGSKVKITVTDIFSGKSASYSTEAKNSSFSTSILLFPISTIDVSVSDNSGRFNRLPSFEVRI